MKIEDDSRYDAAFNTGDEFPCFVGMSCREYKGS